MLNDNVNDKLDSLLDKLDKVLKMNRIHGQYNIIRRCNVQEQNDYHKYRDDLREDFIIFVVIAGSMKKLQKHGFEIDHFVPLK